MKITKSKTLNQIYAELATVVGVVVIILMAALGCSVQNKTVLNEPPVIQRGLMTFANEYGTIRPETFSMYLWPVQDENTSAKTIATVGRASAEIDRLALLLNDLAVENAKLDAEFQTEKCVAEWAELAPGEDPDFVTWVTTWKPGAPESCVKNQTRRQELMPEIDRIGTKVLRGEILRLYKAFDPNYPNDVVNQKSVNAPDSRLILHEDGKVSLTLRDYHRKGNTQSTAEGNSTIPHGKILGAQYIASRKLLVFGVPELGEDGVPNGRIWKFYLERAPDFLGKARFVGDIQVVDMSGKVLRSGISRIEGKLN